MSSRPETGVSKAHGGTSVLLNFTDFPSPLYRFIAFEGRSLVSPSNGTGIVASTYLWCIYLVPLSVETLALYARVSDRETPPADPVDRNMCPSIVIIYYTCALLE